MRVAHLKHTPSDFMEEQEKKKANTKASLPLHIAVSELWLPVIEDCFNTQETHLGEKHPRNLTCLDTLRDARRNRSGLKSQTKPKESRLADSRQEKK